MLHNSSIDKLSARVLSFLPISKSACFISSLFMPIVLLTLLTSVLRLWAKHALTKAKNLLSSFTVIGGSFKRVSPITAESTLGLGKKQPRGTPNKISGFAYYETAKLTAPASRVPTVAHRRSAASFCTITVMLSTFSLLSKSFIIRGDVI